MSGQVGVLHVGYPKGASTFLQKEVFTAERGIVNLSGDPAWEKYLNLSVLRMQGQDYAEAAAQAPPLPQVPEGAMLGLGDRRSRNYFDVPTRY